MDLRSDISQQGIDPEDGWQARGVEQALLPVPAPVVAAGFFPLVIEEDFKVGAVACC